MLPRSRRLGGPLAIPVRVVWRFPENLFNTAPFQQVTCPRCTLYPRHRGAHAPTAVLRSEPRQNTKRARPALLTSHLDALG
ncbi:hypothetical protein C2E23DRAFT_804233 [Lenzites betulinus]|nr:hypothetical protein C2E23DRAFT_804233 [Lenzites betulinus]